MGLGSEIVKDREKNKAGFHWTEFKQVQTVLKRLRLSLLNAVYF